MKVLCIKSSVGETPILIQNGLTDPPRKDVYIGNWYTIVKRQKSIKFPGTECYQLAEMSQFNLFNEKYFAPISDVDETEFERENVKVSSL